MARAPGGRPGGPAFLAMSLALAAGCSGGSSGPPAPEVNLFFGPSTLEATVYQGEAATVTVGATLSNALSGPIYVVLVDAARVIGSNLNVSATGPTTFRATFDTSRSLAAGVHTGSIQVYLCRDEACGSPVAGAPWPLPYRITVQGFDLRALSPVAGAHDWSTARGDAARSGYVPASLDAAGITRRWWLDPRPRDEVMSLYGPVVDAGRVFLTILPSAFPATVNQQVVAIDEATGTVLWRREVPGGPVEPYGAPALGPPAAAGGKVYVVQDDDLVILDGATGEVLSRTAVPDGSRLFRGATPLGDAVLVPYTSTSDPGGGFAVFDASTGAFRRALAGTGSFLPVEPLVSSGLLLTLRGSTVVATDPADGATAWTFTSSALGTASALVASTPAGFVCTADGTIVCIDVATRAVQPFTVPAGRTIVGFVNGVVHASSAGRTLESYDFATGALLGSWSSGSSVAFDPAIVIADGVVFVSGPDTSAVDLATHAEVWSGAPRGALAMSRTGVLYVVQDGASMYGPRVLAFNAPAR